MFKVISKIIMANFLCIVMFVAVVAAYKPNPKFPKDEYATPLASIKSEFIASYGKVVCGSDNARERDKIIGESQCGEPKPVFVHLEPRGSHETVSPGAVWVKRCVGLCEFAQAGRCVARESLMRHVPIRVFNSKTNKEYCATYPVEEHVSCGCCDLSPDQCGEHKVFNRRKCACQCPNLEERRDCQKQRNRNMRWNRSKCACEVRRRART